MIDTQSKYLVAYLDVLGYSNLLVKRLHKDGSRILLIEDEFSKALQLMDSFKSRPPHNEFIRGNAILSTHLKVRLVSDSVLMTLPLFDIPFLAPQLNEQENFSAWLQGFLGSVSIFCLWISGKLGLFFQGGIAMGQHYESQPLSPNNLFIFSQALTEAAELEKKAQYPRILLSPSIASLIPADSGWILRDPGNVTYLNLYNDSSPGMKGMCRDIGEALRFNLDQASDEEKRGKWQRAINDYNQRVEALGFSELVL
jgi:hypothetical protein